MAAAKNAKFSWAFRHFAGDAYLNGKNVAVYNERHNPEIRQLRLETTGGKCLNTKTISKDEYAALRDEWTDGVSENDARVTQRALNYMGLDEFGAY